MIDELLDFGAAHPVGDRDPDRLRWLLTALVRPGALIDVRGNRGLVLAAAVIDTCDSASNAAELLVFGARDPGEHDHRELLARALRIAREGPRSVLEIASDLGVPEALLEELGFRKAYGMYSMRRPPGALPAPPPLPEGLRWADLSPDRIDSLHHLIAEAFARVPGSFVAPLEEVRPRLLALPVKPRLILDGDRVVAFVRVGPAGEIAALATAATHRGRGLGAAVLHEGMRLHGPDVEHHLEVAASNERALSIYRAAGFEVRRSIAVFSRPL